MNKTNSESKNAKIIPSRWLKAKFKYNIYSLHLFCLNKFTIVLDLLNNMNWEKNKVIFKF